MIGFHIHGSRHRRPSSGRHDLGHDPAPPALVNRSPFPWFAVAIVAGVAAVVLG